MPIRVLHAANSLGPGGTEKVMQLFAVHLDRTQFQAAVYSPRDGERGSLIRKEGIPTYISTDLLKVVESFKPHVVHLHRAGWPDPELLSPLRGAGIPVVVETNVFGRHDPSPLGRIIDRHLFVSNFCADRFERETGIKAEAPEYGVLYNPVDTDFFARIAGDRRDLSRPVVGRISRADPGKWSRLALDILPILAREVPGFRYRVIGAIPEAREFVINHGLESSVSFLPPILTDNELAEFLNSISVLAHANDTGESFGLVIAEAMAAGLPVVTHPCPGLRDNAQLELVEHGRTGLVAENATDYAAAVRHLLDNPEEAGRMGQAGREKAQKLFRAQTIARQLEQIYIDLLKLKKAQVS